MRLKKSYLLVVPWLISVAAGAYIGGRFAYNRYAVPCQKYEFENIDKISEQIHQIDEVKGVLGDCTTELNLIKNQATPTPKVIIKTVERVVDTSEACPECPARPSCINSPDCVNSPMCFTSPWCPRPVCPVCMPKLFK